jgi:HNH endonuclease
MRKIFLKGKNEEQYTLVDDDSFERLNKWEWYTSIRGYVIRNSNKGDGFEKRRLIYLHRAIMNISTKEKIDHINHNKMDNRKENLRIVTIQQNSFNRKIMSNNKSGYKGVSLRSNGKYRVWITKNGKDIYGGTYSSKHEAAKVYNKMAVELFGEHACLNFV